MTSAFSTFNLATMLEFAKRILKKRTSQLINITPILRYKITLVIYLILIIMSNARITQLIHQ